MDDRTPTARPVTADIDGGGGAAISVRGVGGGGDVALDKIPLSATLGRLSSAEKGLRCDDGGGDDDGNDGGGSLETETDPDEPDLPDLVVNPNRRANADPFRPLDYSGPATAEDAEPATPGDVYGLAVAASTDEQSGGVGGVGRRDDEEAGGAGDLSDGGGSSDFSSVQSSPMRADAAVKALEDRSDASSGPSPLGFEPVPGKGLDGREGVFENDDADDEAMVDGDDDFGASQRGTRREPSKIEAMKERQRHATSSSPRGALSSDEEEDDYEVVGIEETETTVQAAYSYPKGGGRGGLSKFEVMKRKRVSVSADDGGSKQLGSKAKKSKDTVEETLSAAEASKLDAMKRMRSVGKGAVASEVRGTGDTKAESAAKQQQQPPPSVTVTVLGTAQDGGYPQPGCYGPCCERVRDDSSLRRFPVSLGIVGSDGSRHLVEASRCLGEQLDLWRGSGTYPTDEEGDGSDGSAASAARQRKSPVDSVSITHAHLGHVDGLALFGREVISADKLPVHCSASFRREGIEKNPIWGDMVGRQGAIVPREWPRSSSTDTDTSEEKSMFYVPGTGVGGTLEDVRGLSPKCGFVVRPIPIPHRAELSDTHALLFEGVPSGRRLLFLPDHDSWETTLMAVGCGSLREWLFDELDVDVALLDGTFFDPDSELGGVRDITEIPHPPISDTLKRLGKKKDGDRGRLLFCHLNHTNPLCDPGSKERKLVEDSGWEVASEGDVFVL